MRDDFDEQVTQRGSNKSIIEIREEQKKQEQEIWTDESNFSRNDHYLHIVG